MSARFTLLKHRPGGMERAREALAKCGTCQNCKVLCEVKEGSEQAVCPKCGYVHSFQFTLKWDDQKQEYVE